VAQRRDELPRSGRSDGQGGLDGHAWDFNDRGQVIGGPYLGDITHPFVWQRGTMVDLMADRPNTSGHAADIDNAGDVVRCDAFNAARSSSVRACSPPNTWVSVTSRDSATARAEDSRSPLCHGLRVLHRDHRSFDRRRGIPVTGCLAGAQLCCFRCQPRAVNQLHPLATSLACPASPYMSRAVLSTCSHRRLPNGSGKARRASLVSRVVVRDPRSNEFHSGLDG
jgi:hypothetical protein